MTAVIADDSNILRFTIKEMLKSCDVTDIYEASNGEDAVNLYKKHKPDFITLDVSMDKLDGFEALKRIMKIDPNAKVIMISSISQDIIVKSAIQIGASDYIVKPFSQEQITKAVNRLKEEMNG